MFTKATEFVPVTYGGGGATTGNYKKNLQKFINDSECFIVQCRLYERGGFSFGVDTFRRDLDVIGVPLSILLKKKQIQESISHITTMRTQN